MRIVLKIGAFLALGLLLSFAIAQIIIIGPIHLVGPGTITGQGGGGSVGPLGMLQTSNGSSGFNQSGQCMVNGVQVVCPDKKSRTLYGCPLFGDDTYFNSRIDSLPADVESAFKTSNMQSLAAGLGRPTYLGPSPEFGINQATNSTAAPSITWQLSSSFMDSGTYRFTPSFLASSYRFGTPSTVASPACVAPSCDAHIIVLNSDNCMLYEMFQQATTTSPYTIGSGYIWDLSSYKLRNASKIWWYGTDSSGTTSADVSGAPIWPMILTHDEICGVGNTILAGTCVSQTVNHTWRIAFETSIISSGYQWPATHDGGTPLANNQVYIGSMFRLPSGYDVTTCHSGSNNGQAYPSWFKGSVLTTLQHYGLYFADYGTNGLISSDVNQAWGDTGISASDNALIAGWLHCIQLQDLEVVDNTPRVISGASMQVNNNFVAR